MTPNLTGLRVLVVEDDPAISRLLQIELEQRGMEVRREFTGPAGFDAVEEFKPDLIILDILLPGMDGERILIRLRREGSPIPIIMLTARDRASDKVRNLDIGADDYLTKPFGIEELMARIRAVRRRVGGRSQSSIRVGDLELDMEARRVTRAGNGVELTLREFALLELMMTNARRVLPRDLILERIWGYDAEVDPNILDVYIGYLRKKIDLPGRPRLIQTVRGVGFMLNDR